MPGGYFFQGTRRVRERGKVSLETDKKRTQQNRPLVEFFDACADKGRVPLQVPIHFLNFFK